MEENNLETLLGRWAAVEPKRCELKRIHDSRTWRGDPPVAYHIYWDWDNRHSDDDGDVNPMTIMQGHAVDMDIWEISSLLGVLIYLIEARELMSYATEYDSTYEHYHAKVRIKRYDPDCVVEYQAGDKQVVTALLAAYVYALEANQAHVNDDSAQTRIFNQTKWI